MKKISLIVFTALFGFSAVFSNDYEESHLSTYLDITAESLDEFEEEWQEPNILLYNGQAIPTPSIYQNPFMAPNDFSEVHANSYQTDTVSIRGPGKFSNRHTQDALIQPPTLGTSVLAFNSSGQIITVRVSLSVASTPITPYDNNLLLIDQNTLEVLDSVNLPNTTFPVFIAYFYLDNLDRVVVHTPTKEVRIYSIVQNQFVLAQSYNLTTVLLPADTIVSVIPDSTGNLWFATQLGTVGYIQPGTGQISISNLASVIGGSSIERISKSFATDEDGGVFIVSSHALYRFEASTSGPIGIWRSVYDRGTRLKPGQAQQGSGTTPTLFNDFDGNKFVTIADNADPYMHVVIFNRETGALIAQPVVFTRFPYASSCQNSLIAVNHSVIIENNYGSTGIGGISTTSGNLTTIPGIARIAFDPVTGTSETVWTNYDISIPSAISRLSTKNGLIYTYAKDSKSWYFASLDFEKGKIRNKVRVSTTGILAGDLANNFFAGIGIGRDNSAYIPTLGGITVWRAIE
ncbi:MAG: hypothetical protein Q8K60_00100 [Parachlamydiaceae bacterium]|nr:hypothetical protein [Parachlamydiaceae bacterium]